MIRQGSIVAAALALALGMALMGCDRSDSSSSDSSSADSGGGSGGAMLTGVQRDAADAAMAEVKKTWAKGPDGWTAAFTTGSPYAPDHYLGQFKSITVESVENIDLTESNKLNGIDWNGEVSFKNAPYREVGDPGIALEGMRGANFNRQRGRWTQWVDYQADPIHVWKMNGQWKCDSDTFLLRSNKAFPKPDDFAKAGVK